MSVVFGAQILYETKFMREMMMNNYDSQYGGFFFESGGFKKSRLKRKSSERASNLLAAGVLGHRLGPLTNCMFGQLPRQMQTHSGLNLATSDGVLLVVVGQAGGFCGNALKDVVDK